MAKSIISFLLVTVLLIGIAIGNYYAMGYSSIISLYLGHDTMKLVQIDGENIDTEYFKSDYKTINQLVKAQQQLSLEIQAEGSVLLKNDAGTLPLASDEVKVSLFGKGSTEFLYGGGGAGSIDTSNANNLKEAFEASGFDVNDALWKFYTEGPGKNYSRTAPDAGGAGKWTIGEVPVNKYTSDVKSSFSSYNDAAIIVIGRTGSESSDLGMSTVENPSKHVLELSDNERDLIEMVCADASFDKVIVILNTLNAMECGFLEEYDIDACLWVGAGGEYGINAIPKILSGEMYPSGKLVDTYAYDAFSAPAMSNFGISYATGTNTTYVYYAEGIYVGYKYYETRYADAVNGAANVGSFDYASQVQFPFGYGLSYTTFSYSDYQMTETKDSFEISLKVTNTGNAKGKEAVQIYMQSPYTAYDIEHGVEKSAVELVGYAKTGELQAGASEVVTVTVPKQSMKSYDEYGAGTYIVDAGEYYFAAGKNAHDALNNILAKQGKTTADGMTAAGDGALVATYTQKELDTETYATSSVTGNKISNQLTDANMKFFDENVVYLTRNDWAGTFPAHYQLEGSDKLTGGLEFTYAENPDAELPVTSTISEKYGALSLVTLKGLDYDDPLWDVLLDQLSAEDLDTLVRLGGYSTRPIPSVNKPATIDKDGPAGISNTLVGGKSGFGFPVEVLIASTWNNDIAERFGDLIAEDGLYSGTNGWYAPSMNIHRSPFSGRNFEYFSEDDFISGKMGASVAKAAEAKGLYCYIKHFAFNDQESGRMGISTFLGEQAARELYLAPFETTIVEGGATALMVAMNRIGTVWVGADRGVMTEILRNEWGFEGMAITDQASFIHFAYQDMASGLVAGTDMWLNTDNNLWKIEGYESNPTILSEMRRAAKNILYTIVNSSAMNGISSNTQVVEIMPLWQKWLIAFDVIAVLLALVAYIAIIKKAKR